MLKHHQLAAAEDPVWAVMEDLIQEVHAQPEEEQVSYVRSLSPGRRMVWGTSMVDGEVTNGGFNQFFWNSSRDYLQEAAEGFGLIGATQQLEILGEAVQRFREKWAQIAPLYEVNTLEAFSESYEVVVLGDLDERYCELDTRALIARYIRSHPTEFCE